MNALKIAKNADGRLTISYPEKKPRNQREGLLTLINERLEGNWYAACVLFDLTPNENGKRLLKKWSADEENPAFTEMPTAQYKLMLIYLNGQDQLQI
ncbi:TPA: hypothetical protein ACF35N_004484 [Vibrio parahaemolyticus]